MNLKNFDPSIFNLIEKELHRQETQIELIASENIVSQAVLEAQGSILTNKYAEGYPKNRYYGGCEYVDEIESIAIERVCELFQSKFANVQPHSGSQANGAVYFALLNPGDTILGMDLSAGGHLTHGHKANISGKWFKSVSYGVTPEGILDYDNLEKVAEAEKPKLIIAGGSSYSREIDFKRFKEVAEKVGAYLMVDMAHFAGLVAGGAYPSPVNYADVITSTTHKTLRGPRGGIILTNREDIIKKINSGIFPGIQGGPLMHVIAAKAVAFKEALDPSFKTYAHQIVKNAKKLSDLIKDGGFKIVSGGTDSHLFSIDLSEHGITGKDAEIVLESAGMTCNKNMIPFDKTSPLVTSGIRIGTPAITTRGFKEQEMELLSSWILQVLYAMKEQKHEEISNKVRGEVEALCKKFPLPY